MYSHYYGRLPFIDRKIFYVTRFTQRALPLLLLLHHRTLFRNKMANIPILHTQINATLWNSFSTIFEQVTAARKSYARESDVSEEKGGDVCA